MRAPPATAGRALLEVESLVKYFEVRRGALGRVRAAVRAVDGVSFSIGRGETLGLVGESGSGKTTVGRCILRLIPPTAGRIRFDGSDVLTLNPAALRAFRRRARIVFQDPFGSLNPRLTAGAAVREVLTVHGLARGRAADERVAELLGLVGLAPDAAGLYPHEFSGGQRQRIGIARALSVEPEMIVCDEPVSALDVSVQAQVLNLLGDLQSRLGLSYLFVAHDLGVVRHVSDRIAVMYLGRIVETGSAAALSMDPLHPYTSALLSAVPEPHPERARKRTILAGDVPDPAAPPPGCPFHPRCPHPLRDAQCSREVPALEEKVAGRFVACHKVPAVGRPSALGAGSGMPGPRQETEKREGGGGAVSLT